LKEYAGCSNVLASMHTSWLDNWGLAWDSFGIKKKQSRSLWCWVPLFYTRYFYKLFFHILLWSGHLQHDSHRCRCSGAVECGRSRGNFCGWRCHTVDSSTFRRYRNCFMCLTAYVAISTCSSATFAPILKSWRRDPREAVSRRWMIINTDWPAPPEAFAVSWSWDVLSWRQAANPEIKIRGDLG